MCVCNGKLCKPECYTPFEMIAWRDSFGAKPVPSTLIHNFAMQDAISVIVSIKPRERIKQKTRTLFLFCTWRCKQNQGRILDALLVRGANPREAQTYDFFQIFRKNAWNWENFRPLGGGRRGRLLGSATENHARCNHKTSLGFVLISKLSVVVRIILSYLKSHLGFHSVKISRQPAVLDMKTVTRFEVLWLANWLKEVGQGQGGLNIKLLWCPWLD